MYKIKLITLLAVVQLLGACTSSTQNHDAPLFEKFSVKPILKKQNDVNVNTSTNPLSNYELNGVVGTATLNLSD